MPPSRGINGILSLCACCKLCLETLLGRKCKWKLKTGLKDNSPNLTFLGVHSASATAEAHQIRHTRSEAEKA